MDKPSRKTPLSAENQQKLLFETIKRYDSYIGTTNTKVAVILSYCMAYIGGLSYKVIDLSAEGSASCLWWVALILVGASVLASLFAAYRAYEALNPNVASGRDPHEPPSIFFFDDVANMTGGRDGYVTRVSEITDSEVVQDLARQAHVLAKILSTKMKTLNRSIRILVQTQLPLSLLAVIALCLASY